jgi:hypothetical protein
MIKRRMAVRERPVNLCRVLTWCEGQKASILNMYLCIQGRVIDLQVAPGSPIEDTKCLLAVIVLE